MIGTVSGLLFYAALAYAGERWGFYMVPVGILIAAGAVAALA